MAISARIVLLLCLCVPPAMAAEDARIAASRALVQQFAKELLQSLTTAMQTGGPAAAIDVCQQEAPGIARRIGDEHGARIMRTSLKVRNPGNAPQPWQRVVLEQFEHQHSAGQDVATLEYFNTTAAGEFRYMKAIAMQPACLVCHGATMIPTVGEAISARYPEDAATGFQVGDVRGAFSVEWPQH